MGRKFKGRKGGGGGGGGARPKNYRDYPAIVKENKNLETYYNELLQLPEEERQSYWDALKRELPNSFRFCGSKGHALAVKRLLQTRYIPQITEIEHYDGRPIEAPKAVPWYPDELAWWMTTPKNVVRKFPPFAAFQKFLVSETSVGNISRQEVVSMIPPLLMDLRPGMTVLDMCASPGSKAAQLLEMIHQGEEARIRKVLRAEAKDDGLELGPETQDELQADLEADPSDSGRATGLLIANDADYKRCHMLVHQLKRLSSPNLIVTNHDATQFPSIKLPQTNIKSPQNLYLKFDRILADVPCSGDGTFRKNVNMWKDWQPGNALGLHNIQVRILVRALQLLRPGGRVVYSTCSMNPVENEAVVGAAMERCGMDNVEIVNCENELPNLKRYPGMKTWKIMDKSSRMWSSWEDVQKFAEESNDGVIPGRVSATMFPKAAKEDGSPIPMERCMRVYPHMQDTGGFFIAVLEKKSEFRAKNENEAKQHTTTSNGAIRATDSPIEPSANNDSKAEGSDVKAEEAATDDAAAANGPKRSLEVEDSEQPAAKKTKTEADVSVPQAPPLNEAISKPKRGQIGEEAFKYLDPSHPVIQNIKDFYHLSPRFPDDRYMVRNEMGEPAKAIYYTTALMRDILTENEGRGIKFVHGGVRMYMKQDAPSAEVCRWRIQAEGMPLLQGYVGEPRIICLRNKETFRRLLIEMFPRITDGEWENFDEIGERVHDIGMGCCVLRIEPDGSDPDFAERFALPLWKSIHSLNLMLPKEDRSAMLLRIFNDTSPLINIQLKKQTEAEEKAAAVTMTTTNYDETPGDATSKDLEGLADDDTSKADGGDAVVMDADALEDLPTPDSDAQ